MSKSATVVFCPECDDFQPCLSLRKGNDFLDEDEVGKFFANPRKLSYFCRLRECQECYTVFSTYEVSGEVWSEIKKLEDENKILKERIFQAVEVLSTKDQGQ